jgi:hypothetical protein
MSQNTTQNNTKQNKKKDKKTNQICQLMLYKEGKRESYFPHILLCRNMF